MTKVKLLLLTVVCGWEDWGKGVCVTGEGHIHIIQCSSGLRAGVGEPVHT